MSEQNLIEKLEKLMIEKLIDDLKIIYEKYKNSTKIGKITFEEFTEHYLNDVNKVVK